MVVSLGYRKHGFDAYGGEILRKEDMARWDDEERADPQGVELGLGEEVKEVEPDFFELLPTISAVWIQNPECDLHMTEKTAELFRKNHVILRGVYDTAAERLAREYHLRFLHLDVKLASVGDYFEHGADIITLRFREDGRAYIHQDCQCQGSAPGQTGGGENSFDIPKDFYLSMTSEELADMCWRPKAIIAAGVLDAFMKKAKSKGGFLLDFTKLGKH
ncbi:MAG: hypothetical protein J5449_06755 [Oscillospiraceae bacterium]|nr:hypothetical protein [Oscillospiraceae bacterium]